MSDLSVSVIIPPYTRSHLVGRAHVGRLLSGPRGASALAALPEDSAAYRMGRLCKGTPAPAPARLQVPRTLHPSRRHLEPAARNPGRRSSHLPVERLEARPPAPHDDVGGRGISPPLHAPRLAARVPADSVLRL